MPKIKMTLDKEFERYSSALRKLSMLPEFDVVVDYLKDNYVDPSPSVTGDLVKLGIHLGEMRLAKELIELSKPKKEVTHNE